MGEGIPTGWKAAGEEFSLAEQEEKLRVAQSNHFGRLARVHVSRDGRAVIIVPEKSPIDKLA